MELVELVWSDDSDLPMKYKELQFDDASIGIKCSDVLFRVHRTVLAMHSEIFRDMFALAQPEPVPGSRLAMVEVQDDTEKMYQFLRYIYVHEVPTLEDDADGSFGLLLDIFELSIKYAAKGVMSDCLIIIRRLFPARLDLYLASDIQRIEITITHCIRCITLAERHGIATLLPSLYVALLGYESLDFDDVSDSQSYWPNNLSQHLTAVLLAGTRNLQILKRDMLGAHMHTFLESPHGTSHCETAKARAFLKYLIKPDVEGIDPLDISCIFRENQPDAVDSISGTVRLCRACRAPPM
ncbi:hypothetical protein PENSPDRAFT_757745 [Peniophora sp. CONT]|nr:hypothetical protein PENSPDRAFT_757745 [Peniophora sp. CONT]